MLNNERFMVPELLFHPSGKAGSTWEMNALLWCCKALVLQDSTCAARGEKVPVRARPAAIR